MITGFSNISPTAPTPSESTSRFGRALALLETGVRRDLPPNLPATPIDIAASGPIQFRPGFDADRAAIVLAEEARNSGGVDFDDPARSPHYPGTEIPFDVTRDLGIIHTIRTATGTRTSFRFHRPSDGALAGRTIVSARMEGQSKYVGFAFADDSGISVWRRMRGEDQPSTWDRLADFLCEMNRIAREGRISLEIIRD